MAVQKADWVKVAGSEVIGLVKRVARDGTWAVVKWPTCTKRMQTSVLQVQDTIPLGSGWTVTDVTRQRELAAQ